MSESLSRTGQYTQPYLRIKHHSSQLNPNNYPANASESVSTMVNGGRNVVSIFTI